jgi:D-alanyl-D-alanine carboxypeptidase
MNHKLQSLVLLLLLSLPLLGCQARREEYNQIDQHLQSLFPADGPGVALYVKAPGLGTQSFAAGLSDMEKGKPMRSDDFFRIGPITKAFTSTLILQFIEEGRIGLDDTLAAYLPAAVLDGLENGRTVTIRQLLSMTSGLADYSQNPDFVAAYAANPSYSWTPVEALAYANGRAAAFPPGEGFALSETNYALLHLLAETLTGETLAYTFRDRFLYRLDLGDTYLERAETLPGGHVPGYAGSQRVLEQYEGKGMGDDGLVSTVLDLARFAPKLATRTLTGDNAAASRATYDLGNGMGYGLGSMKWATPYGDMWGYEGQTDGFAGSMWHLPESKITIIALSNNEEAGPALHTLVEDVLAMVAAAAE